MNHSDHINELATALAKAQGSFQAIKRSKTVEVSGKTRDGRDFKYKYAYAPLDEILGATRPALSENELAIIQTTEESDRGTMLKTILVHGSGQWMASYKALGHFDDPQKFGGALTYYRRYEISAILGISSEEDDDANGAVGNEVKRRQPERRQEQPARQESKPDSRPAAPQAEAPAKANGNGHANGGSIDTLDKLFTEINKRTGDFYPTKGDLYKVLKAWPDFKDSDSVDSALSIALDYAREMKPAA